MYGGCPQLCPLYPLLTVCLFENHIIPLRAAHTYIAHIWQYPPPLPRDRFIVDSTSFPGLSLLPRHKGENPGNEAGSILTHFVIACVAGGIVTVSKNFGRAAAKSCGWAGIFTCLQVLWFAENIVRDSKKAPNWAQMLFRVSKTNL